MYVVIFTLWIVGIVKNFLEFFLKSIFIVGVLTSREIDL